VKALPKFRAPRDYVLAVYVMLSRFPRLIWDIDGRFGLEAHSQQMGELSGLAEWLHLKLEQWKPQPILQKVFCESRLIVAQA